MATPTEQQRSSVPTSPIGTTLISPMSNAAAGTSKTLPSPLQPDPPNGTIKRTGHPKCSTAKLPGMMSTMTITKTTSGAHNGTLSKKTPPNDLSAAAVEAEDDSALKRRTCCLRKCIQGELRPTQARVEVKAFALKESEKSHMEAAWRADGEAVFHDICWKAMLDSYKIENPFQLSPQEKELVLEAKKTAEFYDSMEKVRHEAARIAKMLRSAQYAMAFTGAGISTAAGIGDFRGKAGKWTERDREKKHGAAKSKSQAKVKYCLKLESLRPSYTHEAMHKLMEKGLIKHIVSQNTDGIHRLSGIPRDKISELHGNSFIEKCEKCAARYERPYAVRRPPTVTVPPKICIHCHFDHRTGRICERKNCNGYMMNTIINFGDSLEKRVLSLAQEHARKNDLVLCLGSSLRVIPACDLVEMGLKPVKLIICNRQTTPFDKICYNIVSKEAGYHGSRVFCDIDVLMRELMHHLLEADELAEWEAGKELRLQEYALQRRRLEDDDVDS